MDQAVHLDLQGVWETLPHLNFDDVEKSRREALEGLPPVDRHPEVEVEERWIPGPARDPAVRIRIYRRAAIPGVLLPAVLWIHGGGYILGSVEEDEGFCQCLAIDLNAVVVAVAYRLAPEHPFPAGLEDCYTVLQWLADYAEDLGVEVGRIAVAGNSAGGGLTAALALLARDRRGPAIIFQMPLYPMIDDRNITCSSYEIADDRAWNRAHNLAAWAKYLGPEADRAAVSPYAAPARATNLMGLPPTYTMVGSYDVFRDETIDYVGRLAAAGVPVEFHLYPGGFHGFEFVAPEARLSQHAQQEYIDALRRGLARNIARGRTDG